jgi:hypothetical protein
MYHPSQELGLGGAMSGGTVFARELEYYEQHKPEYLKTFPGLYVLIKGDQMLGPFPSSEVALEAGLNRFGLTPFLVKQVLEHEPIGFLPFFSRARERDADL